MMTIKSEARTGTSGPAALGPVPSELAEVGKKQIAAIADAQTEMFDALQKWNRDYFARARSEAMLASDIAAKLMRARTIPETGTAYQEWLGRWATTLGEDSQRLFADGQKVLAAGGRLFTNGWDGRGD
jgi:hypothetical protein